jgi:hypothetical protein
MDVSQIADLQAAFRQMLAALWIRAMNNDLTIEEVRALQRGCMAIAIADRGAQRVLPFPDWDK